MYVLYLAHHLFTILRPSSTQHDLKGSDRATVGATGKGSAAELELVHSESGRLALGEELAYVPLALADGIEAVTADSGRVRCELV